MEIAEDDSAKDADYYSFDEDEKTDDEENWSTKRRTQTKKLKVKLATAKDKSANSIGMIVNRQTAETSEDEGKQKAKDEDNESNAISVPTTNNLPNMRKYDKSQYCFYCEIPPKKLNRHLRARHGDKHRISEWVITSDPIEKQKKLTMLRNLGNHKHNAEVLRNHKHNAEVLRMKHETRGATVAQWLNLASTEGGQL